MKMAKKVLFIGDHGAGKSTLCNLLIRGEIYYYRKPKYNTIRFRNKSIYNSCLTLPCNIFPIGEGANSFTKRTSTSQNINWDPYDTPGITDLPPTDRQKALFRQRIEKLIRDNSFDIICMVCRYVGVDLDGPAQVIINKYTNCLRTYIRSDMQNKVCFIVTGPSLTDQRKEQVEQFYLRGLRDYRNNSTNALNPNRRARGEDYPIIYISGNITINMTDTEITNIHQNICHELHIFLDRCNNAINTVDVNYCIDRPFSPEIRGASFISFEDIKSATYNFSQSMVLGKGGFSTVYKGSVDSETKWAVKRATVNYNDTDTFKQEIINLAQIKHVNLVELLGYCLTVNNDQIIVLEYMAGGTLYDAIHNNQNPLTGKQRIKIALETAEGLNYLHKYTRNGIVHCDMKSNNILLDANGLAKISDFGLSREGINDNTPLTHIAGTYGYMDPQWFGKKSSGLIIANTASDVYAFGVVLFELITGKSALVQIDDETHTLASVIRNTLAKSTYMNILDQSMRLDADICAALERITILASQCCSLQAINRPTMDDVVQQIRAIYDRHTAVVLSNFNRLPKDIELTRGVLSSVIDTDGSITDNNGLFTSIQLPR
jgi:predicted Ser/Thr protein kinase/GTPase SAR1 family protein